MRVIFIVILLGLIGSTTTSLGVACAGDAASLIEGVRLNAMGWRKFDVLIESSNVLDTPEKIEERKTVVRLLYDVERERCFYAIELSTSVTQPHTNGKTAVPDLTVELRSRSIAGSSFKVKDFPGRSVIRVNAKSFNDALKVAGVPVMEAIGVWDFPLARSGAQKLDADFWNTIQRQATLFGTTRMRNLDSQLVIRIPTQSTKPTESDTVLLYEFDHNSLMPVSRRLDIETKMFGGKKWPYSHEKLTWEKRKDIFVPTQLQTVYVEPYQPKGAKDIPVERDIVVKFSWLKVNEPLDETLFAADSSSRDILHKALDPQELGLATED